MILNYFENDCTMKDQGLIGHMGQLSGWFICIDLFSIAPSIIWC